MKRLVVVFDDLFLWKFIEKIVGKGCVSSEYSPDGRDMSFSFRSDKDREDAVQRLLDKIHKNEVLDGHITVTVE